VTHYDPEFEEMAREFRRAIAEEQAEIEEIERETEVQGLDLPFAMLEAQWRGDMLRVVCPGRAFVGRVIHVGENIITLATETGATADVCLTATQGIAIVEPGRGGGVPRREKDPVRFVARLRELVGIPNLVLEFGTSDSAPVVMGRLAEVRADHIMVVTRDNARWMVPLGALSYCVRVPAGR
jgi:hypothetical protein